MPHCQSARFPVSLPHIWILNHVSASISRHLDMLFSTVCDVVRPAPPVVVSSAFTLSGIIQAFVVSLRLFQHCSDLNHSVGFRLPVDSISTAPTFVSQSLTNCRSASETSCHSHIFSKLTRLTVISASRDTV